MTTRTPVKSALRLVSYDVLTHLRGPRWLLLPPPAFVAAWLAADDLDFTRVAWGPGDLVGAVVTVPMLVALLFGLPIAAVTTDLALRQLRDGNAALTATRLGTRWIWWNAKLVALGLVTLLSAAGMLLVVAAVGATRSGSLSILPGQALDELLRLSEAPASSVVQHALVVSSPLTVSAAIWPTVAIAAAIGIATRSNIAAGATVATVAFISTLTTIGVEAGIPSELLALLPSAAYALPLSLVWSQGPSAWLLTIAGVCWLVLCGYVGTRCSRDLT